jgi:hypothetical protein
LNLCGRDVEEYPLQVPPSYYEVPESAKMKVPKGNTTVSPFRYVFGKSSSVSKASVQCSVKAVEKMSSVPEWN